MTEFRIKRGKDVVIAGPAVSGSQSMGRIMIDAEPGGVTAAHEAASDPHAGYQRESEKNAASGYAGLNTAGRTTKGLDVTDDLIVDTTTKGLVMKDSQAPAHYWRLGVTILGIVTTTDLGTTKP